MLARPSGRNTLAFADIIDLFSGLYGWLFYQPYWGHAGWLSVIVAALLLVIAASVVVGWRDMTDGW